jgi:hypothetical protein
MDNADDLLKGIYDPALIAERKAAGQAAYEERIIRKILVRLKLDKEIGKLGGRAKEKTGRGRLTFEWFYEEYPSFPAYVGIRKIPFAHQVTMKDLFGKFTSTPMFKAWEEFRDEAPVEDKPIGLVFDWPGVQGTQMVIHNWDRNVSWFDGKLRFVQSIGRANPQLIIVEQLEPFLVRAEECWIPG